MATQTPPPYSAFLAPRYWPTWAGIASLSALAWLPYPLRKAAGTALGWLTWKVARERRYITTVNIALCFPELDQSAQQSLVKDCFIENGRGLMETAAGWIRPQSHFLDDLEFIGEEHFIAAQAHGKGVLIMGAHYSTLDFGANLMAARYPFGVTYRAHKNPLFDAFILRGRLRNCNGVFDRKDIRGAFRHLKQGKVLWYAPDQDYGPEQAVFVPLFGHEAATITAGSRFASINGSPAVLSRQERDHATGKYLIEFMPLPGFPSGDDVLDATRMNQLLEQAIRKAPAQYLWMHKRFKSRPGGKSDSPYILVHTPNRKLSESQYAGLIDVASPLACDIPATRALQLPDGLVVLEFAGVAKGMFQRRHAALRLDRLARELRSAGLRTLTVDSIFRVPSRQVTAVTCFLPEGESLRQKLPDAGRLAQFLAALHNSGFHFTEVQRADLIDQAPGLALLHPLHLAQQPGSAGFAERRQDLLTWAATCTEDPAFESRLVAQYLPLVRGNERTPFTAWLAAQATPSASGQRGKRR